MSPSNYNLEATDKFLFFASGDGMDAATDAVIYPLSSLRGISPASATTCKIYFSPAVITDVAAGDVTDFVTYVLRADPDLPSKSYIYVALGGEKLVSLPSKDVISSKVSSGGFEVKLGDIKTKGANDDVLGDYIQDIKLFGNGKPLVDIPLVLRFSNGQWTSDYAQKGKAPTFYPYFETFFGAQVPNETPKGEVE